MLVSSPKSFLSKEDSNKISFESTISKELHQCMERVLDRLEEKQIINDILNMIEETGGVKRVNEFKSIEEIKEYLKREADNYHSKQLTRTQSEHNYASSSLTNVTPYGCNELSDEGYISPCEENAVVVESNPRNKIYDLRGIEKLKKRKLYLL